MFLKRLVSLFLLLAGGAVFAQTGVIDSLNQVLKTAKDDTTRAQVYIQLTEQHAASNIDTVIPLCEKALAIAETGLKSGDAKTRRAFQQVKVSAYNNIGYVYSMKDDVLNALEYYSRSKTELDGLNDKQGLANYYISVGYIYNNQGDIPRALDFYERSYALQMEIGDKHGAASSLNNIAVIYNRQNDTANALIYFNRALAIYRESDELIGQGAALNNIATIFEKQHDTTRALQYYRESLAVRRKAEDKRGIGSTLTNMGVLYDHAGDPVRALAYYTEALPVRESARDKKGVAMTLVDIAALYDRQNNIDSALVYAERALQLGLKIGYPEAIASSSEILSSLYAKQNRFKDAYDMHVLYKEMSDSIQNIATKRASFKAQLKYSIQEREAQLKADQQLKDAQNAEQQQKQLLILYAVSAGLVLVLLLALFVFRGYRQKQRANEIITAQKAEAEHTKLILEEKNKDILDSLNYAKRIQRAKLPNTEDIWGIIPESFILFLPKDIVSGDFYFFREDGPYVFLAAADCTGHGVPGALMSMIGYEVLNEAITLSDDVGQVLKLANRKIKSSLRQSESDESTRDGMDIALCRIDLRSHQVHYAGANRPLWIIRRDAQEVEEIKATKTALGGFTSDDHEFEKHEIQIHDGDTFYLFSDGYADLFNGETGKKLTTKKLRQLLLNMQEKDLHTQEVMLGDFAREWKKGTEQIDDILVIGVRL